MPELCRASLNPHGPNHEFWFRIFGHNPVPLQSPQPIKAIMGEEKDVECYLLNLQGMTLGQKARLLGFIAQKFGVPVYRVEQEIARDGFPIRAKDVIVSISMRAVI